ncbi:phosphoglycerate mutase family protein [Flavobacterium sp.]|uniref:phosphoglycerate mutase family protein n=1 Tax=Flavobacterium sp. TaxID=239 RepID=UPI00286E6ACD|nr:phosphoglycerate mutase family protein [Flavobacterium sp.]
MKIITILLFSIISQNSFSQNEITNYYLIRHAEKVDNSKNPELSDLGKIRAENYKNLFSEIKLDYIYSKDFIRTTNTVNPTAIEKKLEIIKYIPKDLDIENLKKVTLGKNVLIVGHSNSTPDLVNRLINEKVYTQIDETQFGNLYIVTIIENQVSHKLLKLQ